MFARVASAVLLIGATVAGLGPALAAEQDDPLASLERRLPATAAGFDDATTSDVVRLATATERYAFARSQYKEDASTEQMLNVARALLSIQQRVDAAQSRLLEMRTGFASLPDTPDRKALARNFLRCSAVLTDLSGRIRYLTFDTANDLAADTSDVPDALDQLIGVLIEARSSVGAAALAPKLFDSPQPVAGAAPLSPRSRLRVLDLIRASRQNAVDAELARFVRQPGQRPELVLAAATTLRAVGMPQPARPGADPALPKPEIAPAELYRIVQAIDPSHLSAAWGTQHAALLAWLDAIRKQGIVEDSYRLGKIDVRPGDWLLMRNPSPYNLFTDLSPGLYTHVGVVTAEVGSDGIRRFVVIDLPERGNTIPATPIDMFVKRTLNYTVLRDSDPAGAAKMARTAVAVIDNPSRFDLRFRTDAIERLQGQKLRGTMIQGYCAGLLLLCAQESGQPRDYYFPLGEHPAGGKTLANLGKLGISMGQDFLSPTGPLFASRMKIVGGRDPLYDPRRQIEEAVYDRFARNMAEDQLVPSPDWYQSMRQSLAESSKSNPLLAKALANAAGVNENMDLVAAAKLGAVVESLDEIAYGASAEFASARSAVVNSDQRDTRRIRLRGARGAQQQASPYLTRHADLVRLWKGDQLSPRELRQQLVDYYIADGNRRLDERFFRSAK